MILTALLTSDGSVKRLCHVYDLDLWHYSVSHLSIDIADRTNSHPLIDGRRVPAVSMGTKKAAIYRHLTATCVGINEMPELHRSRRRSRLPYLMGDIDDMKSSLKILTS